MQSFSPIPSVISDKISTFFVFRETALNLPNISRTKLAWIIITQTQTVLLFKLVLYSFFNFPCSLE